VGSKGEIGGEYHNRDKQREDQLDPDARHIPDDERIENDKEAGNQGHGLGAMDFFGEEIETRAQQHEAEDMKSDEARVIVGPENTVNPTKQEREDGSSPDRASESQVRGELSR